MILNNTPIITVIIPVYNDLNRLQKCLQALSVQSLNISLYEIIIINNSSSDYFYHDFVLMIKKYDNVTLLQEDQAGSYIARNKAIPSIKSKYIAFTDSDCIPKPAWLEKGLSYLESSKSFGLVGGKIELFYKNSSRLTPAEIYEKHTAFQQQRYINQYHFAATANMFTRKKVFDEVGLFNESLKSSGDKEWGERVYNAQYNLVYAEDVIVKHPARSSLRELYAKRKRVIGGVEKLRNKTGVLSVIDYDLLDGMIPPIKEVKLITKSNSSLYEKVIALTILVSMNIYSTFIRLQLRLGGEASR